MSNFPDGMNWSAFAERYEQPEPTTDELVAIRQIETIERLRMRLQVAIEAASDEIQDHYSEALGVAKQRQLTPDEIEDLARAS